MNQIKIVRTSSLARLRNRLSHPIKNINTIVVGLDGIRNGSVDKAFDLSVRWEVGDPIRTTDAARGFAIASLMVAAYDALDQYLRGIGTAPSPISKLELRSLLCGEKQITNDESLLAGEAELKKLTDKLLGSDAKDGRVELKKFIERHYGKPRKPSLRARFDALNDYVDSFSNNASTPPKVKPSYVAAMTLLIVWRNIIVHEDSKDTFDSVKRQILLNDSKFFFDNHAAIDIEQTLDHFDKRQPPTLKDVSTLVSIMLRTVASIDASLVYRAVLPEFFRETVWFRCCKRVDINDFIRRLEKASPAGRAKRIFPLLAGAGFVPDTFQDKAGSLPAQFFDLKDTFLVTDHDFKFLSDKEYVPSSVAE